MSSSSLLLPLLLLLSAAVSVANAGPVLCSQGNSTCPGNQTCGGKCGPGVCCDLAELHCSKGGSWCPDGGTCGGPICGPGPSCCDETVAVLLQRPVNIPPPPFLTASRPLNSSQVVGVKPLTSRRRCRPGVKCIDNFPCEQGGSSCPSGQTCGGHCGEYTCCTSRPVLCGQSNSTCPANQTCGGKCGPGVCCDLTELHCSKGGSWCPDGGTCGGPICGPGPSCCDETVAVRLQRPVNIPPTPFLTASRPLNSSEVVGVKPLTSRRRCQPGVKCIDNFACEQGGSSCPSGQTCGGHCGEYTCCTSLSEACGEGGDVCPAGYSCRPCALPRGSCCFSDCVHPGAYPAEPCGMDHICRPCESEIGKLCCLPRPNSLESCRLQCGKQRGKKCYLFGCPQGEGWCCR